MKIYTKKGDEGTTQLLGGTRVPKHHLRIEAYGTVDELNSWLGYLGSMAVGPALGETLQTLQSDLFTLGSHLANDPETSRFSLPSLPDSSVELLEKQIDEMESELPPLKNFVLPGGCSPNAVAHIARTVCRRAERATTALHEHQALDPIILKYLNRLSDWLFVVARVLAHRAGVAELSWKPRG